MTNVTRFWVQTNIFIIMVLCIVKKINHLCCAREFINKGVKKSIKVEPKVAKYDKDYNKRGIMRKCVMHPCTDKYCRSLELKGIPLLLKTD